MGRAAHRRTGVGPLPSAGAHLVLTDAGELADDRRGPRPAGDRAPRTGLVASGSCRRTGRCPTRREGPPSTPRGARARTSGESLAEDADADAGFRPAPTRCRAGSTAWRTGWSSSWRTDGGWSSPPTRRAASGSCSTRRAARPARVAELESRRPRAASAWCTDRSPAGFAHAASNLLVLTDRELFGAIRVRRLAPAKRVVTRDLIGKLSPGDLVVHVDHGVARYVGMTQREYSGAVKEYLQLDFAGDGKIFLPSDQIGRITRYAGGPAPTLSKLGGHRVGAHQATRRQRAVDDLARELLEIYAARESASGFSLLAGHHLAAGARRGVPVQETPDQARTIEEVKADMLRRRPMDRLVCGDVGLRQDRGRPARGVQGGAGRQAGRGARADHGAGPAARDHLRAPAGLVPGAGRDALALRSEEAPGADPRRRCGWQRGHPGRARIGS